MQVNVQLSSWHTPKVTEKNHKKRDLVLGLRNS
jgi:hypothetical protein